MPRAALRRGLLVLVVLGIAALGMLAERRREQVVRVDVGEADDGRAAVSGWHPRERAWDLTGRWTDGQAVLRAPRAGRLVSAVRVALCAHPRRPDDQVRIGVGALDVTVVHLAPGCQAIDVPVRLTPVDAALSVDLASAATSGPGDPRPLGVFVDWIEVRAGGAAIGWARGWLPGTLITILLAAAMLAAWDAAAVATGTRLAGPAIGATLAGVVAWTAIAVLVPSQATLTRGAGWGLGFAALAGVARVWRPRGSAPAPTPARARLAWSALALGAALAVFFHETLLAGRVLSQSNLLYQVFPWRAAMPPDYVAGNRLLADIPLVFHPFLVQVRDAFASGTFPLWSPRLYTGHPFFASFQSAVLSPFTWLSVAVPLPWGTVAGAAARLAIGGLGALVFARRIGLGTAASTFCALAFGLNTFSIVWLEHPPSAVAAWLPWLLVGAERLADAPGGRTAAALAGLVALTIFAGHPETALKVLALGGLYGLAATLATPRRWRAGGWLVAAYALGLLATAMQVLPFAEYLGQSRAHEIRQTITTNPYFLSGDVAVTAVVPDFWGDPVSDDHVARANRIGIPTNYNEQQLHPGVVAWVLAVVGVVAWRRRWRVAFFVGAALISAAFVFTVPAAMEHVTSLPLLRMTIVSRFSLIVVASVILLAAFGIDALVQPRAGSETTDGRRLGFAAGLGAALVVAGIAWALVCFHADLVAGGLLTRAASGGLFAGAVAALTWGLVQGRTAGRVARGVFGAAACGLVAAELLAFGIGFRTFVRPAEVFPAMENLDAIRRDPGLFRVAGIQQVLPANTAMAYGLSDPRGYDGMGPARLNDLLDVGFAFLGSYHSLLHAERSPLVNLLNIKYVLGRPGQELSAPQFTRVSAGGSPVFLNHEALPRAFLVDGYTILTGNAARRALRDRIVDPRRVVVLEAAPAAEGRPETAPDAAAVGVATVRHYRDRFVEVTTTAPGRRLLVLSDLYYPGWTAEIDGEPTPILRANFAFRGVSVPAGVHTVRFAYRPRSFHIGLVVSTIAIATLVGLAVIGGLKRSDHA